MAITTTNVRIVGEVHKKGCSYSNVPLENLVELFEKQGIPIMRSERVYSSENMFEKVQEAEQNAQPKEIGYMLAHDQRHYLLIMLDDQVTQEIPGVRYRIHCTFRSDKSIPRIVRRARKIIEELYSK